MQPQLQTEETQAPIYTSPVLLPAELADEETHTEITDINELGQANVTAETNTSQHAQAVHAWLGKIQQKARRDKVVFRLRFFLIPMVSFLPVLILCFASFMIDGKINPWALAMPFLPAVAMMFMFLRLMLTKPDWNAEEMTRVGGVQAVGTLIDLIQAPKSPRQMTPLFEALTELLPLMKASDAALLTKGQRKILYWSLKTMASMLMRSLASISTFVSLS